MLAEKALAFYDKGVALPYVIQELLRISGTKRVAAGMLLLKSALAMHDRSPHKIHTPIKQELGTACIEVGDAIISIKGHEPRTVRRGKRWRILLEIEESTGLESKERTRTRTCPLAEFVAQIVTLRAIGANAFVRRWLAALPG